MSSAVNKKQRILLDCHSLGFRRNRPSNKQIIYSRDGKKTQERCVGGRRRGMGKGDRAGKTANKRCVLKSVITVDNGSSSCKGAIRYISKWSPRRSWQHSTPAPAIPWLRAAPWANSPAFPIVPAFGRALEKALKPFTSLDVSPGS